MLNVNLKKRRQLSHLGLFFNVLFFVAKSIFNSSSSIC